MRTYQLFFDSLTNYDKNTFNQGYLSFSLPQPLRGVKKISLKSIEFPYSSIQNFSLNQTDTFQLTVGGQYANIVYPKQGYFTTLTEVLTDLNHVSSPNGFVFDITSDGKVAIMVLANATDFIIYGALDYYKATYGNSESTYTDPTYASIPDPQPTIAMGSLPLNLMLGFRGNSKYYLNNTSTYKDKNGDTRYGFISDVPANISFDSFFYMYFENVGESNSGDGTNASFKIINPNSGDDRRGILLQNYDETYMKQSIHCNSQVPIQKLKIYFYNRFNQNMLINTFPGDVSFTLEIEGL
jgi:hypothetical protein